MMPSTPSSPTASANRRRSLRLASYETNPDLSQTSYTSTNGGPQFSRRSSRASQTSYQQPSPSTPRHMSSRSSRQGSFHHHRRQSSSRLSIGSNVSIGQLDGGAGNLADELEDALEDEYETQEHDAFDGTIDGNNDQSHMLPTNVGNAAISKDLETTSSALLCQPVDGTLQPTDHISSKTSKAEKRKSKHQRSESKYDGSDYGPESDQDDDGLPPMLAKRIRDVESLTRMSINTEDTLSEGGGVVKRTIHALKDLGPQAGIENNLSRIIAAYTSMATHRTHKTRELFGQAHSLLYGNLVELPEEAIDVLLDELEALATTLPFLQQQNPLISLQMLASQTMELAHTLRGLTDALQESRISANTASRKLKSVKDMVDDLRIDENLVEESMILIQAGDWDRRCRQRQAAATCREVILGFGAKWDLEVEDRPWTRKPDISVSG